MAITAKFAADFTDFDKGVKAAEKTMLSFQQQVEQTGGRLMDVKGYRDSTAAATDLAGQLRQLDGVLAQGGVNIGPHIRAISELGAMAGKTAGQVGALGSAVGLAGAAMTGWNIGRFIADLTGSDKLIADFVNNLRGVSDASARAAAKADVLALASKNAGRPITDFNEAVKENRKAADDLALAWGRSVNPLRESNIELANWQREIRELRKRGDYEALTADFEANALSVDKLSKKYGMHTDALEYLRGKIAETAAAESKAATDSAAANARRVADMEATAKAEEAFRQVRWKQQLDLETKIVESTQRQAAASLALTNNAVLKELEATLKLTAGVAAEETAFTRLETAQGSLQAAKVAGFSIQAQETVLMQEFGQALMDAAIKEEQARFAAQGVGEAAAAAAPAVDLATGSVISAGSAAQQTAGSFFQMSEGLYAAIHAAQQMDALAGADKGIFANTIGGIGGSSASTRYMGAANSRPPVAITINGSVLGNKDEIARVVGDAVTSSYRSGGNRLPV